MRMKSLAEGFIVKREPKMIWVRFGSIANPARDRSRHSDGLIHIEPGENFFNWSFEDLKQSLSTRIVYQEIQ